MIVIKVEIVPKSETTMTWNYQRTGSSHECRETHRLEKKEVMKQKMKTHTAMAKRVKVTGSGKFMRRKVAASHLRRNKSPQAVRSMDKEFQLATSDTRRLKRLLPYAF